MHDKLRVVRLSPIHLTQLATLFGNISADPSAVTFHPHPFDDEHARMVCSYKGKDQYLALFENNRMQGYGMLRGWDAGYDVASLGIYIVPEARGRGLSLPFMKAMHDCARSVGASRLRLKVYPSNTAARKRYEKMGYQFKEVREGQLVGFVELGDHRSQ